MADKWDEVARYWYVLPACPFTHCGSAMGGEGVCQTCDSEIAWFAAALRTAVAEEHTRTAQQAFGIALELMDSISIEYDEKEWHELAARYREYREIVALFDEHVAYNEAQDAKVAAIRARTGGGE